MSDDPFDFFEKFFNEIFKLSQTVAQPASPYHYGSTVDGSFRKDGREIIPYPDRWIMVEEIGVAIRENETTVNLVEDKTGRYVTLENPITNTKRRYKLAKNMTGKFDWSVRNGYLQLDLYINNGEIDDKGRKA